MRAGAERSSVVKQLDVQSPCRQVCQLNTQNICIGCGRSLDEIAEWPAATSKRKLQIREQSNLRLAALQKHTEQ